MKRPVKITLTRQESMYLSTKRHAFETDFTIGVDAEGKLQFLDAKLYSDAGPYNNLSVAVLQQASIFAGGPYVIPNVNVQGKALRTNNVLGGAFRGFGINQSAISIETLLDEAAEKLGMDPFEIRKINALKIGTRTVGGELLKQSVGISDTIELCKRHTQKAMEAYKVCIPKAVKSSGRGGHGFKNVGVGRGNRDDGGCISNEGNRWTSNNARRASIWVRIPNRHDVNFAEALISLQIKLIWSVATAKTLSTDSGQ